MAEPVPITLFCEDRGHEQFIRALIGRLAREAGLSAHIDVRNARGGHARALEEFDAWQRAVEQGALSAATELLVVVVDANCQGWSTMRDALLTRINGALFPRYVVGCPDPHIERWCLADPESFYQVIGGRAPDDPGKCLPELYKNLLRQAIAAAEQPVLIDEMDFAPDLVEAMKLFRAGKNQPSLKHFVDELKAALRSVA